jgi:crossover junction endodeoxyribonuclease RuvC
VRALLDKHAPSFLVVEDLYAEYRFPRTAILMGHARGVIYLAAAQQGVAVLALAPAEVKRAIAANGAASKGQVERGVQMRLHLPCPPRPSHVADALGLALIGLSRAGGRP